MSNAIKRTITGYEVFTAKTGKVYAKVYYTCPISERSGGGYKTIEVFSERDRFEFEFDKVIIGKELLLEVGMSSSGKPYIDKYYLGKQVSYELCFL